MVQSLTQGASFALPQGAHEVRVAWADPAPELDVSAFILGAAGRVRDDADMVFFNQPASREGAVRLLSDRGRPLLAVDLARVDGAVASIAITVTMDADTAGPGQTLGQIAGLSLTVAAAGGGAALARYAPGDEVGQARALILAELYRRGDGWRLRAVGQGFAGGLGPLARGYGIAVDDDPAPPPAAMAAAMAAAPAPAAPAVAAPSLAATPARPPGPAAPSPVAPPPVAPPPGVRPSGPAPESPMQALSSGAYTVLDRAEDADGTIVEVLNLERLQGSSDLRTAERLYFANSAGLTLKMVRITLRNGRARLEPGALYFMKGNLEMRASTGGGILKGLSRKILSGETFFVNQITGTGEIWLEPSFGHFLVHRVDHHGPVICDRSMFLAGTGALDASAQMQRNVSSALFGGEGLFQTFIKGESGIAVLFSPVPRAEIQVMELNNEKLSVDGNFALMRTAGIEFRAEKSSKSLVSTAVSGEGILQTFTGTGKVWLAVTQGVYEKLSTAEGLIDLARAPSSMGTRVAKT